MKIIFAEKIGFCFGVRRAIDLARGALKNRPKPVYFLGEVVHNEAVVREIKKGKGRIISDYRQARKGTLAIRAHGEAPFTPNFGVLIEDATCPLVKKAQEATRSLRAGGYEVVIIGDKDHAEVQGIIGYAGGKAIVIEDRAAAENIGHIEKMGVVAQTTQNAVRAQEILKILKTRSKKLKWIDTLCPEVSSRQKELFHIIKRTDGILVIGSLTSANTQRLAEIAGRAGKPVWRANSLAEVKRQQFGGVGILGVVSGTSAPDWEVDKIRKYLCGK